jgi:DNA-binding GntR family transcriptional regulator
VQQQQHSALEQAKFKMKLTQAKIRGEVDKNKAINSLESMKKVVMEELRNNRNPTACIRMEQVLREESTVQGYELFNLFIKLLKDFHATISTTSDFNPLASNVREAIATLAFASTYAQ